MSPKLLCWLPHPAAARYNDDALLSFSVPRSCNEEPCVPSKRPSAMGTGWCVASDGLDRLLFSGRLRNSFPKVSFGEPDCVAKCCSITTAQGAPATSEASNRLRERIPFEKRWQSEVAQLDSSPCFRERSPSDGSANLNATVNMKRKQVM